MLKCLDIVEVAMATVAVSGATKPSLTQIFSRPETGRCTITEDGVVGIHHLLLLLWNL